jgi:hypothetical protein
LLIHCSVQNPTTNPTMAKFIVSVYVCVEIPHLYDLYQIFLPDEQY